jgi:hypothetical protein
LARRGTELSKFWFKGNLCTLVQLWHDRYPPEKPREPKHTPLEKLVLSIPLVVMVISLANFKELARTEESERRFMDGYVAVAAILTTVALLGFYCAPCVCAVFATYRIVDSTNYRVYFLLVRSQRQPWKPILLRRSLVIAVINLYECVVGYAILYLFSGGVVENTPGGAPLTSRFTALYYSFVTMLTVGYGDYVPKEPGAKLVVIAQLATILVFLIFLVPTLISVMSAEMTEKKV